MAVYWVLIIIDHCHVGFLETYVLKHHYCDNILTQMGEFGGVNKGKDRKKEHFNDKWFAKAVLISMLAPLHCGALPSHGARETQALHLEMISTHTPINVFILLFFGVTFI